jgi:hypothetical protein
MGDWGSGNTRDFSIPGYVPAKGEDMQVVTDFDGPEFFHTMRIPIRQGRDFTRADAGTAPNVAIINEKMAGKYWPKGNALGSSIVADKLPRTIVGIVPNYMYHSPDDTDPGPVLYLPLLQGKTGYGYAIVAIRSRTTPGAVAAPLRQTVANLDSSLPLENVRSLEDVADELYQGSRVPAELLGAYAFCSVLVAIMGLYAVMAYSVIERHREFAVRMALGATRGQIIQLVVNGGMQTAGMGLLIGALGSFFAVRLMQSLLFGVGPFDLISFAVAALVLVLTVLLAGLAPARRAATIQPMQALKAE